MGSSIGRAPIKTVTRPTVRVAAVIGISDNAWGEAVHTIIVPNVGPVFAPDDVINHCRKFIECPHSAEVRDSPLPLPSRGKVLELCVPFW